MDWDTILNGAATVTNAAANAASYVLPALAGGNANQTLSGSPGIVPVEGTPAGTPIGVYSVSQIKAAEANGMNAPTGKAQRPAWLVPAAVVAVLAVGYLVVRRK